LTAAAAGVVLAGGVGVGVGMAVGAVVCALTMARMAAKATRQGRGFIGQEF